MPTLNHDTKSAMVTKSGIALLTTVANFDLYNTTSSHFPTGIRRFVIDGTNGMHALHSIRYMMRKLRGKGIEWLIMADEDVVFVRPEAVFSIIADMEANGHTVCGVRDGGVVAHRKQNPHLPNTFFCILRFDVIEAMWNAREVAGHQHARAGEFDKEWDRLPFPFDEGSVFEPYYCFFLWLRRQGKTIRFLEADMPFADDAITNAVYYENRPLLYHTWYARSYGKHQGHTQRIDRVLERAALGPGGSESPVVFRDATFALRQKALKWMRRILMKIANLRSHG